jgi:uncharacterized protein with LGFP repeats
MKVKYLIPTALLAIGFGAIVPAGASPARVSAQSIIVNPVPAEDLHVRVWVDRDPGGYGSAVYRIGDRIRIGVNVDADANVYLFNVNASGEITLILPNGYSGGDNVMYAGETRTFPAPGAGYEFMIDGPAGVDRVLAVASTTPLDMDQIYNIESGSFYDVSVSGQNNLARALSIVVQPLPSDAWVTDVVQYTVRR